jgi:hypothetical protein
MVVELSRMMFQKKKMIPPKMIRRRRRGYNTSDNREAGDYENIPEDVIPETSQAEHDKSVHELINATKEHSGLFFNKHPQHGAMEENTGCHPGL